MEAAEEEEVENQAGQERRQAGQRSAAAVEAIEEPHPPATMWLGEGGQWDQCKRAARSSNRGCSAGGGSNTAGQDKGRDQWLEWQQSLLLQEVAEGAAGVAGVVGGAS